MGKDAPRAELSARSLRLLPYGRPRPDRPDAGPDRHPVSGHHQQRSSHHLHRRPPASQRSQPYLDGLLHRALGRRHAGGRYRRVQRPRLARHRRASSHRSASHHRTLPPPRLRSHGSGSHHRRSENLHPPVLAEDCQDPGPRYGPDRERLRKRPLGPAHGGRNRDHQAGARSRSQNIRGPTSTPPDAKR